MNSFKPGDWVIRQREPRKESLKELFDLLQVTIGSCHQVVWSDGNFIRVKNQSIILAAELFDKIDPFQLKVLQAKQLLDNG
ncbi:hypothetical protein CLV58_11927 [Spirosoma oryzae]|uniref:Uncharacterized protein n=1 Tax=Spirosoma oryzae TaxID=1469603 RepID=A0A2T0SKD8_9BACT|nr:hypothetical protein [Spirosoma oryzae]PRY33878.1 hypothetical protein CLV58_11927 [Spirosoma oryzae]